MSLLFPSLVGQGWSVHKKPKFDTRVAAHATGREARVNKYLTPMWDFELTFDALDMTATGDYGALGAQSMQTLAGFFLQCQGKANPFVYVDPTDNTITNATVAVADGVTTTFTLTHPIGAYSEPVAVLTSVSSVRLNGANIFGWVAQQPNQLVFGAAPPAGAVITADFRFGYSCRFTEDVADFEEFMAMLSGVKTLQFQSVRDIVPFDIIALRTLIIQFPIGPGEFCAPVDWNPNYNRVIAIGGGQGGGFGATGAAGGGGAYTYRDNIPLAPTDCVPIVIGAGGPGGSVEGVGSDYGPPGDRTYFATGSAYEIMADSGGYSGFANGGYSGSTIPSANATSGGQGGFPGAVFSAGGGGGGGAGGPFGDGGQGGSTYTNDAQAGGGGGGADGGAKADDPVLAYPSAGTAGGAARDGTPGGIGGYTQGVDGLPGSNGSGGGGGGGSQPPVGNTIVSAGGAGSTEPIWFSDGVWYGPGSGGGGGGGIHGIFIGTGAGPGGDGGKFGGGGGAGTPGGKGGDGALIIIYLALETSS